MGIATYGDDPETAGLYIKTMELSILFPILHMI
jgi:hypothetical protein